MKNRHAPITVALALAALLTTACTDSPEPRRTVLPTSPATSSATPGVTPASPDASGSTGTGAAETAVACAGGTATIAGEGGAYVVSGDCGQIVVQGSTLTVRLDGAGTDLSLIHI